MPPARMRHDVLAQAGGIQDARQPQRATERPPPLREVEAAEIAMQGSTTTRQPTTGVRDEHALDRYDA